MFSVPMITVSVVTGSKIAFTVLGLALLSVPVVANPGSGIRRTSQRVEAPAAWVGQRGAVLFEHATAPGSLGLWALTSAVQGGHWTAIPGDFEAWQAVAMDGSRLLFVHGDDGAMALGTLDHHGRVVTWLPLQARGLDGTAAIALDGHHVLFQADAHGPLTLVRFDNAGQLAGQHVIWNDAWGWLARGMDANRILLEHMSTGEVTVLAMNPRGYTPRPYRAFTLAEDWSVRDFAGDFVLVQNTVTEKAGLIRLGDDYAADREFELAGTGNGWLAIALSQGLQ